MDVTEQEKEKKRKRNSLLLSLGIHALLILFFAFLVAWREPNPPLPEYGIEINFGTDNAGTGDTQPETEVTESESTEEPETNEEIQEEIVEEVVEETSEPVEEEVTDPVEEVVEESAEEVIDNVDSPDVVKPVEEEAQDVKETVEEPVKEPVEEVKEESASSVPTKGEGESKEPAQVNQGDKTDEVGDQGREEGKIDARALYGNPGSGGGSSLKMAGWTWDEVPRPDDTSDENGRIVFEITIDEEGYIVTIKTIETTVSPAVEKLYKAEVEALTFSKTDNSPAAPRSKGTITFIIKSN